uniref:SUN domain-containing protein n=1 Tax=Panagrolaimus davidi TaxID=227884 RepID=A0A914P2A0_9BILA
MSIFWRPYLPLLIILNFIYILYPYIRIGKTPITLTDFAASFNGANVSSHSKTYDPKTNILYLSGIPLIYLSPNEPNILLQRPVKNLRIDDCWLMKGSNGYVEIELEKAVYVHQLVYHHFNQTGISDSTPKIIDVEAITNTILHLGTFNIFDNVITQIDEHNNHTVVSRLRFRVLQNYGNQIFTTLCRFQIFGEEENMNIN